MSADCFYCGFENEDAHPTCDDPACEAKVHGYGPEGKTTTSYCPGCSSAEEGDA